ncbi:MAG TPA: 2OG-Fe(II) oxygenase [Stellaceae bacterium]|nr:2OG-Fe(II) oxygenase [Stellaceae bacterium]
MERTEGDISVTLMLGGGHQETIRLTRNDQLLSALLGAIGEKGNVGGRPVRCFNIHVDQGRRSLIFSSADLVGLVTDPPLTNEAQTRAPAAASVPQTSPPIIEKSRYVLLDNFIDPARHAALLKYVMESESRFAPSTVSTNDKEYRRSLVLHEFPEFAALFRDRVRSLLPQLAGAFGLREFPVADIECQLTASNDGDYFKLHNDSGSPDTIDRVLTYVFYFNNEPRAYSGGEFRLFDSRVVGGHYECGDAAAEIAPKNNSILFFPSHCHHEVLPVRCPSNRFLDSRFTINGWVRRAKVA